MKKTLLLLLVFLASMACGVSAQIGLVVNTVDNPNSKDIVLLADLNKLDFADGNLVLDFASANQPSTFAMANVLSVKFVEKEASVDDIMADATDAAKLYCKDELLGASGVSLPAAAVVYDLTGQVLLSDAAWDGSELSVSHLAPGVYIFKVNNEILKFQK